MEQVFPWFEAEIEIPKPQGIWARETTEGILSMWISV